MQKCILPKSSVVCGIGINCLESFEVHMFAYEPIQFFRNGFVQDGLLTYLQNRDIILINPENPLEILYDTVHLHAWRQRSLKSGRNAQT